MKISVLETHTYKYNNRDTQNQTITVQLVAKTYHRAHTHIRTNIHTQSESEWEKVRERENLFIFPISPNRNKLGGESDINFRFFLLGLKTFCYGLLEFEYRASWWVVRTFIYALTECMLCDGEQCSVFGCSSSASFIYFDQLPALLQHAKIDSIIPLCAWFSSMLNLRIRAFYAMELDIQLLSLLSFATE